MVSNSAIRETTLQARFTMIGVRRGMLRLMPVAIFVIPFGIGFGAAAVQTGVSTTQASIMSGLVFAGASQFAVLDLWQSPLPLFSLALVALAVNARHIIMGAALSGWINQLPPWQRALALVTLSDANFADTQTSLRSGDPEIGYLLGSGLMLWMAWTTGTILGATIGSLAGNLDQWGVDVVMPAFFAAVVCGDLRQGARILPVIIAATVALVTIDLLPAGWNIIAAAAAGGLVGAVQHGR